MKALLLKRGFFILKAKIAADNYTNEIEKLLFTIQILKTIFFVYVISKK